MAWARLDDGWHDHHKTIEAGLEAAGLWVMCLTWASKSENRKGPNPGVVPVSAIVRIAGDRKQAAKLSEVLHRVGFFDDLTDAGWPIHDFSEYLPKYSSEQAKAAGSRGGQAKHRNQTASKPLTEPPSETGTEWGQSA